MGFSHASVEPGPESKPVAIVAGQLPKGAGVGVAQGAMCGGATQCLRAHPRKSRGFSEIQAAPVPQAYSCYLH